MPGIRHPLFELRFGIGSPGRIIGGAQINDIRLNGRIRHGQEPVLRRSLHEPDLSPPHAIGIQVDRIDRIRNQDHVGIVKNIRNIATVAFRTVADKDLGSFQRNAEACVILHQRFLQKAVALLRSVTPEGFLHAHFRCRFLHRFHYDRRQGQRHIADSQTNDLLFRMGGRIRRHFMRHLRKQITVLQGGKILIDPCHDVKGSFANKKATKRNG